MDSGCAFLSDVLRLDLNPICTTATGVGQAQSVGSGAEAAPARPPGPEGQPARVEAEGSLAVEEA
jgi:hypothetical protein